MLLISFLLFLLGCSMPDFIVFKQKVEFKENITKEYSYKVASYVAKKLEFAMFKEIPYNTIILIKSLKNKVEDDYKVKPNEKLENSKQLILILGISEEGYIFKSIVKKDLITIAKSGKGIKFKEITDDEISSSEVKYEAAAEGSEEEKEILSFIEEITNILKIKKDIKKLKESELTEQEKKVIPLPQGE